MVTPPWAREGLLAVKQAADPHGDAIAQTALAGFIHEGHLARHVRRMRTMYAARREVLLEGLAAMEAWFTPIPSEAGLHLAVRILDAGQASRLVALTQRHAPGVVDITSFALRPTRPALAFGYGVIDEDGITASLQALWRVLQRG